MERTADQEVAVLRAFGADPWGNPTAIANGSGVSVATDPDHIANINPYRYAGYRYDTESGLCFLQAFQVRSEERGARSQYLSVARPRSSVGARGAL